MDVLEYGTEGVGTWYGRYVYMVRKVRVHGTEGMGTRGAKCGYMVRIHVQGTGTWYGRICMQHVTLPDTYMAQILGYIIQQIRKVIGYRLRLRPEVDSRILERLGLGLGLDAEFWNLEESVMQRRMKCNTILP